MYVRGVWLRVSEGFLLLGLRLGCTQRYVKCLGSFGGKFRLKILYDMMDAAC